MKKIWGNNNLSSRRRDTLNIIYSADDFYEVLERERARADRSNQCFSLVVFNVGLPGTNGDNARRVVSILASRVRVSDEIGWFDKRCIGVILPDTSAEGAWKLADEVCQEINGTTQTSFCSVYTYPSEGLPVDANQMKFIFNRG